MRPKNLTPAERLIVAADFEPVSGTDPGSTIWVENQVLGLAIQLQGTGVTIKINSALRAVGARLTRRIKQESGLDVFDDYKFKDIEETLKIDGLLLNVFRPKYVTVMCDAGVGAMRILKAQLPNTQVIGVTVLTNLKEEDVKRIYRCSIAEAVLEFGEMALEAGIDGLVCSPSEVEILRNTFGDRLSINTPAIRPVWADVKKDDQNLKRVKTPAGSIRAGSDTIIVGRPISGAADPREAALRTIEEIAQALQTSI